MIDGGPGYPEEHTGARCLTANWAVSHLTTRASQLSRAVVTPTSTPSSSDRSYDLLVVLGLAETHKFFLIVIVNSVELKLVSVALLYFFYVNLYCFF